MCWTSSILLEPVALIPSLRVPKVHVPKSIECIWRLISVLSGIYHFMCILDWHTNYEYGYFEEFASPFCRH